MSYSNSRRSYSGDGARVRTSAAQSSSGSGVRTSLPPPPPGADPTIWQYFVAVDANRSGSIDANELRRALVNRDWTPFDGATIAMLQSQFSGQRTGELVYAEFAALYAYIASWSACFRRADTDGNGTIDEQEMGIALINFGYSLDAETLHMLMLKYSPFDSRRGITFDRFVRACVVVKSLTEGFQRFDPQRRGVAQMPYKDFMQTCLRAP